MYMLYISAWFSLLGDRGNPPPSRKICSFTLHLEQFLPPPKVNSFPTK